ncbi:unnamed protein product, partial [Leptidea sinapis]
YVVFPELAAHARRSRPAHQPHELQQSQQQYERSQQRLRCARLTLCATAHCCRLHTRFTSTSNSQNLSFITPALFITMSSRLKTFMVISNASAGTRLEIRK